LTTDAGRQAMAFDRVLSAALARGEFDPAEAVVGLITGPAPGDPLRWTSSFFPPQ
jgi:hypothetical protein